MEFGVHLPLISFAGRAPARSLLCSAFAEAARDLGYTHLCANDHLVFSRPVARRADGAGRRSSREAVR